MTDIPKKEEQERRPLFLDELTKEQFDYEMQKSFDDIAAGRVHSFEEVMEELKKEFGI